MGRVLVTGATGFLGRAVVHHLARSGRTIRAAVRTNVGPWPPGTELVMVGDLADPGERQSTLSGVDVVVHCAARAHILREEAADPLSAFRAVNTFGALDLAHRAAKAGVRRFVFISSIGVNGGETRGRAFRNDDPPAPHSPYAISKLEAEQGLSRLAETTGMDMVIIRPPLIIGAEPKGNLASLVRLIESGWPLPFALVTRNRRDLVSRDTLCELISIVTDHPAAAGETFLVSDGLPISTRILVERLAADLGRAVTLWPVPPVVMEKALQAAGRDSMAKQLFGDLELDIAHTCRTLGWTPERR